VPFTTRNDVRIHYEVHGEGPPVVFNPPPFADRRFYQLTGHLEALRTRHRVILIDPRGHGQSDRPREPGAHRIDEYRDDLTAVLNAADVGRAVFVGPYDGIFVAYALAVESPDRVSGLIDYDAIEGSDLCDPPECNERQNFAQRLRTGGVETLREHVKSYGVSDENPIGKNIVASDPEMVALELEAWTSWRGPFSLLPRLRVPTLFLRNGETGRAAVDRIRQVAADWAEIHVLQGVSHWSLVTEVAHTLPMVRNFLGRLES